MSTELLEDRDLALALHRLLTDIDPLTWRKAGGQRGAEAVARLRASFREIGKRLSQTPRHAALAEVVEHTLPAHDSKSTWLEFKRRLQPRYVELARRLQAASIHVPSLRPTNYARSLMHVGAAGVAVTAIALLGAGKGLVGIALAWAGLAWSCEIARRLSPRVNALLMRLFSPVAHAHEAHKVNSATWYATALVLLSLTHSATLALCGVVVLGVGDPLAGLVGRRFGKTPLLNNRSLEGSLAFLLSASAATFVALSLFVPGPALPLGLVAVAASFLGAVVEVVSVRVDDNFSIPLSAAAAAGLASVALGLPL